MALAQPYVLSCNFSQYLSNNTTTQNTSNMYTTKKGKKNVCDFTSLTMQGGVVKQVIWLSANCFSWISSISYYLMDLASSKPIYLLFLWKLVNIGCLMQERWADSSSSSSSQYSLTISPLWITGQKAPYKAIKNYLNGSQDTYYGLQTTAVLERAILWASSKSFRNLLFLARMNIGSEEHHVNKGWFPLNYVPSID